MISLAPLASSSAGNAYKLSATGSRPLLLDCGIPFPQIQRGMLYEVTRLAGCLVTHAHQDHCKAVNKLMAFGAKVYATAECWKQMGIKPDWPGRVIEADKEEVVGDWKVKPFKCVHDSEGTVGFFIAHGENRIVYMTDTAYSRYTFEGLTHLYIECNHSVELMQSGVRSGVLDKERYRRTRNNHMSLETLLSFLGEIDTSKLKEVVLLHLSDGNSDERHFKESVQKKVGCPVYVAGAKGGAA